MIFFFRHPCEDILFDLKYSKKRMSFRLARKNILFYFKKKNFFFLNEITEKACDYDIQEKEKEE